MKRIRQHLGTNRVLGTAAGTLGFLALFAGSSFEVAPEPDSTESVLDIAARRAPTITAVDLAEWLRNRKPGLRLVDLRSAAEFAEFHLPRAENIQLPQLASVDLLPHETVTLYAGADDTPVRGWLVLEALGFDDVFVMNDGVRQWLVDVMNPVLSVDATPEERAAFARASELSRYFGGLPRVGSTPEEQSTTQVLKKTKRRGCAF